MKKYVLTLFSSLALLALTLLTPASAQTGAPGGGPSDPAVRARMQALRPIFDLVGRVSLLGEMDAQKALAITKAQAKALLPILRDLQVRSDLNAKDAAMILAKIEDKILTDQQVTWLDDTQLKREEERRQRFQNGGAAPSGANGTPPAGAGAGGGAMFQAIQAGKPFNPFKDERMGKPLTELVALLAKR